MPDTMMGKPVGFTCSTFDLLHAGHILMLAECKQICEDRGIKIWFNSRSHRFSSSELRQRTYQSELGKNIT